MIRRITWILLLVIGINSNFPAIAQFESSIASNAGSGNSDNFVGDAITQDQYMLGPGDQLSANLIIGDSDMSKEIFPLTIGPDGTIFFPNVGEINLLGLSIPEAKALVDARIKKVYKEKYILSFRLIQPRGIKIYLTGTEDKVLYQSQQQFVSVYGEVNKAGRFSYIPNKKFSDYISYAGGPTQRANLSASSIARENQKIPIDGYDAILNGDVSKDLAIKPGDVVNVPSRFFYFYDFNSFSSLMFTFLAFYNTFIKK